MTRLTSLRRSLPLLIVAASGSSGCDDVPPPAPDYYDRVIQPILSASCIRNQGSCHIDDGIGGALGNLDLTSYENTTRRKDVVRTYGSYPEPLLLIKGAGPANAPSIPYKPGLGDGKTAFLQPEIQHVGGAPISRNSEAFFVLQQWLDNGAHRDGAINDKTLDNTGHGDCTKDYAAARPDLAAKFMTALAAVSDGDPSFVQFKSDVQPILVKNCAFGSCHSSAQSDFFLSCDEKFNFLEAREFLSAPPESSEFLLRPLAPGSGGVSHTGGVFFASKNDDNYQKILGWAKGATPLVAGGPPSAGRQFFADHVMPVMLKRGCALEACHSPGSSNDFKLRPGSQGYFSNSALDRNYEEARRLFLDVDVPDPRVSRIFRKPIVRMSEGGLGIPHRGGPVLQSPDDPADLDPTKCPPFDAKTSTPFCTFVEWHRLERQSLLGQNLVDPLSGVLPIVFVERAAGDTDRPIDVDTYHPGSDLVVAHAALGPLGRVTSVSRQGSILGSCPGSAGARDVRRPDVDYDGDRVIFAMRLGGTMNDTWDLYTVKLDGSGCAPVDTRKGAKVVNGLPIHDLDPIFVATGANSSVVFASTRGKSGPTLSLKYLTVATDLWKMDGSSGALQPPSQLTAVTGSELSPSLMMNGQITMTSEKASPDYYQLSGRRINWDGTDYHPLLAQRKASIGFDPNTPTGQQPMMGMHPSVGFQRATEIREGLDRSFVFIASNEGDPGMGGQLVTFNRSGGPFEQDRTNPGFLRSVDVVDDGGAGAFRSPIQLPDGRYLVAYAPNRAAGDYSLAIADPATHSHQVVLDCGSRACIQPVLAYKRERKPPFVNVAQLVFGGRSSTSDLDAGHAVVTYPDLPLLSTLLNANLRTGRFVDGYRAARQVAIFEDAAPTDVASGMAGMAGTTERVYSNRKLLGTATLDNDGSVKLQLPSLTPLIVELRDPGGKALFTMSENDQLGGGEHISRGVPQPFFNSVCAGCHGSISGRELDVAVDPDALTGASRSLAHDSDPQKVGP